MRAEAKAFLDGLLADGNLVDVARLVVVGDARVLDMGMAHAGVKLKTEKVASPAKARWSDGVVPLVDLGNIDPSRFPLGKANAEKARGESLQREEKEIKRRYGL